MASILLATDGLPGMLCSSLGPARRLEAAGHRSVCASCAASRESVQDHGFEHLELPPDRYRELLQTGGSQSTGRRP